MIYRTIRTNNLNGMNHLNSCNKELLQETDLKWESKTTLIKMTSYPPLRNDLREQQQSTKQHELKEEMPTKSF